MTIFVALLATLALVVLSVLALMVIRRKQAQTGKTTINYRVFFRMGIGMVVIAAGLVIATFFSDLDFIVGMPFLTIGIIYISIGLGNRNKQK